METSTQYINHVNIMKDLQLHSDFYKVREPFKEGFEEIYEEAKKEDVKVDTAKEFLHTLSQDELSTLQNYSRLVEKIDIDELSDEGAYNLMMHFNEKFDFDKD
ncbi:MAG: hypothetical protein U9N42_05935, partial [Campylobacterota bacterium]|nr:hypothetical protein [Campylobacterota bacterium]